MSGGGGFFITPPPPPPPTHTHTLTTFDTLAALASGTRFARPARPAARHARQLALKLLANVTYGYTAAGFSGRMPCAEVADAIVSTARATLERAAALVEAPDAPWAPARVVYGDTDSLFVRLPARGAAAAWAAGEAMAAAVTRANARPIELKLEKVYVGTLLAAKKK